MKEFKDKNKPKKKTVVNTPGKITPSRQRVLKKLRTRVITEANAKLKQEIQSMKRKNRSQRAEIRKNKQIKQKKQRQEEELFINQEMRRVTIDQSSNEIHDYPNWHQPIYQLYPHEDSSHPIITETKLQLQEQSQQSQQKSSQTQRRKTRSQKQNKCRN